MGEGQSFYSRSGACFNTAIGESTLFRNNGNHNVAIGHDSMKRPTTSNKNTFVGWGSGNGNNYNPPSGSYNVGIGYRSMEFFLNGNCNTGVGYKTLRYVSNGNGNVAIGTCAGINIVNANDTIAIGYNAQTSDANGHTVAGNSSMNCFVVSSNWTNLSDCRDKTDIESLDDNLGLNFVRNLRPVKFNFDFRNNYKQNCGFEYGVKDGTLKQEIESYGFIAQEIESTLNNLNTHFDALNKNEDGDYRFDYENLISPIVKSLQQTIQRLEILESKI
jgi:hypothetical protein